MTDLATLAREPSPEAWRLLCERLAAMPEPAAMAAIAELDPLLATWPDELRATMCGMTWDDRFFDGDPDPRSVIVRYLRFESTFFARYSSAMMMRERRLTAATIATMCASPGLRHLTRVNLNYQVDARGLAALAACPHFEQLRWLSLDGCKSDGTSLAALGRAAFYPRLELLSLYSAQVRPATIAGLFPPTGGPRELALGGNALGPEGATAIAIGLEETTRRLELDKCELGVEGARALARIDGPLAELSLDNNQLGDAGLAALAGGAMQLEVLELSSDAIGVAGVRTLLAANWPLRRLVLADNAIDDSAAALIAERGPPTLEVLSLSDNDITAAGLAALIGSPRLRGLRELALATNRIGALDRLAPTMHGMTKLSLDHNRLGDGIRALAAIDSDTLRELSLVANVIDIAALEELTGASWFGALASLDLSDNPLGPGAGVLFASWPLAELTLARTGLGDDGVAALARSGLAPKKLVLDACELTDRALEELVASPALARLEYLSLRKNRITDRGMRSLVGAAPPRLQQIIVDNNQIGDDGILALAGWSQLLHIGADNNSHGDRGTAALSALPTRCCP